MSAQITGTTGTFTQPFVKAFACRDTVLLGLQPVINIQTGVASGPAAIGLGPGNMFMGSQAGIYSDFNGYQELNSFLQFWCANTSQSANAALLQIHLMTRDMIRNPEMRRQYSP